MVLVSSSVTELSDGEVKNTVWISRESMLRNEQVEHRHRERQTSLKLIPGSLKNFLDLADGHQERQGSLDKHAFIVSIMGFAFCCQPGNFRLREPHDFF